MRPTAVSPARPFIFTGSEIRSKAKLGENEVTPSGDCGAGDNARKNHFRLNSQSADGCQALTLDFSRLSLTQSTLSCLPGCPLKFLTPVHLLHLCNHSNLDTQLHSFVRSFSVLTFSLVFQIDLGGVSSICLNGKVYYRTAKPKNSQNPTIGL